jgi:(1->4)-alpha-D-glucan 1-alpha-D-glucosylmutase
MNRFRKRDVDGDSAPSRNDEYLLYQTLAGSFPPEDPDDATIDRYRERIQQYMVKAAREAKLRTSWLAVNEPYEVALTGFVGDLLHTGAANPFLDDLREQSATFAWFGMLNSLSMTLLKLASPGVPDIYQGNEVLDLSLVDPDNRRPVDYGARRALLASFDTLRSEAPGAPRMRPLFESPYDGRAKLWVVERTLASRRERPDLFAGGKYHGVTVKGARERHVVAFRREHADSGVLVVAGRLFASLGLPAGELPLGERWGDTKVDASFVPSGTRVENRLTGETLVVDRDALDVRTLFRNFPGALLHFVNARSAGRRRSSISNSTP